MRNTAVAFLLGVVVTVTALMPSRPGPAAEEGAVFYYDMGAAQVQFETENCGLRTLLVAYQIEHANDQDVPRITGYKPKVEAVIFATLSDYLMQNKTPRAGAVQSLIKRAAQGILGKDVVQDVLITDIQQLDM
jgi:flagellar basal body-associated protein FliL